MTPHRGSNDYSELTTLMQATITPLVTELQIVKNKVDLLNQDRVTRSDLKELSNSFVSRDYYNVAHRQIEESILDVRKDQEALRNEAQQAYQRLHERLESGKQQLEDRMKQQHEAQLSLKDRAWLRFSQVASVVAILASAADILLQHVKFS